jgi:choline dehydrogenase
MRYDVIVIGAGSAGCVMATRLSEDPNRSVLLLEAGPDYPNFDHLPDDLKLGNNVWLSAYGPHNWGYEAQVTPQQTKLTIPRGKATGGSSAVNGQVLYRGIPEDYDNWAKWGNDEWSFVSVLPYFRKMETDMDFGGDFHGSDGPVPVRRYKREEWLPHAAAFHQACLDAGFPDDPDQNHPESTGVSPRARNTLDGVRISMALAYLDPARHRLNLTIRGGVTVRRILFDGKRATGVEVESGSDIFTVEGDQIVLSSGAIGSPQILMLSGVGPAASLRELGIEVVHDLPGVGQNLRDHPSATVLYRATGERPDVQAPAIQVGMRYTVEGSYLRNDMQITPILMTSEHRPVQVAIDDDSNYLGFSCSLQLALGAGELKLTSTDPHVQPFLNYNYLTDPFDRERLRKAVRLAIQLAENPAFKDLLVERVMPTDADLASDEAMDDWLMRSIGTSHHVSCTCKMGPASDPMAVVSQYGQVHGLSGLWVADASIMPDCIRANTNATTIMIGERVAEFLQRQRQHR